MEELKAYQEQGCEVVPSMNIITVKPNEKGDPYQAKSRTVALGNLEQRTWTKEKKYAPVLTQTGARILVSEAFLEDVSPNRVIARMPSASPNYRMTRL